MKLENFLPTVCFIVKNYHILLYVYDIVCEIFVTLYSFTQYSLTVQNRGLKQQSFPFILLFVTLLNNNKSHIAGNLVNFIELYELYLARKSSSLLLRLLKSLLTGY